MRVGKAFTLIISNGDVSDIIEIIKLLEDSGIVIDGVTETVKHEIRYIGYINKFLWDV